MSDNLQRNSAGAIRHIRSENNEGMIDVNLVDDRYLMSSLNYIVNTSFNQIEDAITSQLNVLQLAANATLMRDDAADKFVKSLSSLVNVNSSSPDGLKAKIAQLENQLTQLSNSEKSTAEANSGYRDRINALRYELQILQDAVIKGFGGNTSGLP
jgi:septal ring factor EnvC (AmiA/AmiB activator)